MTEVVRDLTDRERDFLAKHKQRFVQARNRMQLAQESIKDFAELIVPSGCQLDLDNHRIIRKDEEEED